MPKISIIIPVYNSQKYLRECLDSVVNQTLTDIEIICVDDKSTDNSLLILKEYAQRDNRIKIIEQKTNLGIGSARNSALDMAEGEYVMFADSDDRFDLSACEKAYNQIVRNKNDFVFFNYQYYYEDENKYVSANFRLEPFKDVVSETNIELKNIKNYMIQFFSWAQIYSLPFLRKYNIKFGENRFREDSIFFIKSIVYSKNVSIIKDVLYYYRQHSNSVSKSFDKNWKDVLDVTYDVINFINSVDNKEDYLYEYLVYAVNSLIYWLNESFKMKFKHKKELYNEVRRFFVILKNSYDINKIKCNINYHKFKKICDTPWVVFCLQSMVQKIFSIQTSGDRLYKIVCIFGIKIRIKISKISKKFLKTDFAKYQKKHQIVAEMLKEAVKHRKLRVCFLVSEIQKWNAQSLYDEMEKSEIFEPFILVTKLQNDSNRNSYQSNINYFKKLCKNVEIGFDEEINQSIDIKTFAPDIIFYQQPWELWKNQNVDYSSDFALPYHFSYAISDPAKCLFSHLTNFYLLLQKYFVFSKNDAKVYKKSCGYKENYNLSIVGHPKLDTYMDYKEDDYERKYVIYAPHHSLDKIGLQYATFEWSGTYMLEWAKTHPEYNWIFKPHPRLRAALIEEKFMTEQEVDGYFSEWETLGQYCNDGLYFDMFKNSRCLITDCGAFLIEYLPTRKPVIHLRNHKGVDYMDSTKVAMKSYYDVWNIKELEKTLEKVLVKNIDTKKSKRIAALKSLKIGEESATEKIINVIMQDVGL